jgi:hypothetical protein
MGAFDTTSIAADPLTRSNDQRVRNESEWSSLSATIPIEKKGLK